jgi:hypothetical protein
MTSTERQTVRAYPWDGWKPEQIEVLPEEWAWCFNLKEGVAQTLEQDWEHKRDSDGISVSRKSVSPPRNPANWPRLTYQEVHGLYTMARVDDIPVVVAFLKVYPRNKLSDEQIEMLAAAPRYYIGGPKPVEVARDEESRRQKAAALLAEVDGTERPAPKLRGQAVKV